MLKLNPLAVRCVLALSVECKRPETGRLTTLLLKCRVTRQLSKYSNGEHNAYSRSGRYQAPIATDARTGTDRSIKERRGSGTGRSQSRAETATSAGGTPAITKGRSHIAKTLSVANYCVVENPVAIQSLCPLPHLDDLYQA